MDINAQQLLDDGIIYPPRPLETLLHATTSEQLSRISMDNRLQCITDFTDHDYHIPGPNTNLDDTLYVGHALTPAERASIANPFMEFLGLFGRRNGPHTFPVELSTIEACKLFMLHHVPTDTRFKLNILLQNKLRATGSTFNTRGYMLAAHNHSMF
jgi:hypothetical protein